jgi:hypothetical protein
MKSDMTEKRILLVDGEEVPGLINIEEYVIEQAEVEIPSRDSIIPVKNGVTKIPAINAVYKISRNSLSLKKFQNWFENNEYHEVTLIRTDGAGQEFGRELWPNTELSKLHAPAYDAASPVAAQVLVRFLPEKIIFLDAEG